MIQWLQSNSKWPLNQFNGKIAILQIEVEDNKDLEVVVEAEVAFRTITEVEEEVNSEVVAVVVDLEADIKWTINLPGKILKP